MLLSVKVLMKCHESYSPFISFPLLICDEHFESFKVTVINFGFYFLTLPFLKDECLQMNSLAFQTLLDLFCLQIKCLIYSFEYC